MNTAEGFAGRLKSVAASVGGQAKLAERSGVPKGTLASYVQGTSEPTVERLVALARAGGVSVGWLATGCDSRTAVAEQGSDYGLAAAGLSADPSEEPSEHPTIRYARIVRELDQVIEEAGYEPGQAVRQAILTVMFRYGLPKQGAADMLEFFRPTRPPGDGT